MKYVFDISIYTDDDFGFQFVPCGMRYDQFYKYTLEKSYNNRDEAIEDITKICVFLKENIHTSRDYVKEGWDKYIDGFIKRLQESSESAHERVSSRMSGNYDGTEFDFRAEAETVNCSFYVTDEEFKMIAKNDNNVTNSMVKEAVLALFKKS